ncbi:MAG: hypothetical protein GXO42_00720 [bacterium]|nr:hypothetical protein [bacterium]
MYDWLELKLEQITPAFFGDAENSAKIDGDLRTPALVAAWKRALMYIYYTTASSEIKQRAQNLLKQLPGKYSITLYDIKHKSFDFCKYADKIKEIRKNLYKWGYEKIKLDFRLGPLNACLQNSCRGPVYLKKYSFRLAVYFSEELDKELVIKSWIYTFLFSGIGKISSKGFGRFRIKELSCSEQVEHDINKLFKGDINEITKFLQSLGIRLEAASRDLKQEEGCLLDCLLVKEIPSKREFANWEEWFVYYIAAACFSKLKSAWKIVNNIPVDSCGKKLHTFVLGLPRSAKCRDSPEIGGYILIKNNHKIPAPRLLSQIKYCPFYVPEEGTAKLLLVVYPHAPKILEQLFDLGLYHCSCPDSKKNENRNRQNSKSTNQNPCQPISKLLDNRFSAISQALEKIEKVVNHVWQ